MSAAPLAATAGQSKVLCSIGTGPQSRLLALARPTFRSYARRHGYDLVLRTEPIDGSRPVPWSKIALLRDLLRTYDIALWIDADAMIIDGVRDIAEELEPGKSVLLVQHCYGDKLFPNTGVMLLRAGRESEAFLDDVWSRTELRDHEWWENAAVLRVLGYELNPPRPASRTSHLDHVKFISTEWNSIVSDRARRPRIRHYPGYSLKTRFALMLKDLIVFRIRRVLGRT